MYGRCVVGQSAGVLLLSVPMLKKLGVGATGLESSTKAAEAKTRV